MKCRVNVIGVGLTPFTAFGGVTPYNELIAQACRLALQDAGIEYRKVESVYAGFVYGDSISGQWGVAELGLTGVPIINVGNHAASGSTALYLAREAIEYGIADCVLAVGFEHDLPDAAAHRWRDAHSPVARHSQWLQDRPVNDSHIAVPLFAAAAREYQARYGTRMETLAMVAVKSREHAQRNPYALLRQKLTLDQVLMAPPICAPLTLPQCCLPACGAAAVLLCSDQFARKHGLGKQVLLAAQAMTTDLPSTFSEGSAIQAIGYDLSVAASRKVYEAAGIGPQEVDVCELHDSTSANELLLYEALGFCREGDAQGLVEDGDNTYGGNRVINPSGGLLAMGHPLGATGIAQCVELVWHLRGSAGERQVPGARVALQHNQSIGGACIVTLYRRD